jgi:hypothetical protein
MDPIQIAEQMTVADRGQPSQAALERAAAIIAGATPGEAVVAGGLTLAAAGDWLLGHDALMCEIASTLELAEARRGAIEKEESEHFSKIKAVADRIVARAADHHLKAETISSGDVHAHPFVVEIQAGENRLFPQSQVVSVTIHDTDDLAVELPNDLAAALGRKNSIAMTRPSELEAIMSALERKLADAARERPPTGTERRQAARAESEAPAPVPESGAGKMDVMRFMRSGTKPPAMSGTFAPY